MGVNSLFLEILVEKLMKKRFIILNTNEKIIFPTRKIDNFAAVRIGGKIREGYLYVTNKRIILVSRSIRRLFKQRIEVNIWLREIIELRIDRKWFKKILTITCEYGHSTREIQVETKYAEEIYKALVSLHMFSQARC